MGLMGPSSSTFRRQISVSRADSCGPVVTASFHRPAAIEQLTPLCEWRIVRAPARTSRTHRTRHRRLPMGAGGIGFVVNPILIVVGVIALGLIAWLFVKR